MYAGVAFKSGRVTYPGMPPGRQFGDNLDAYRHSSSGIATGERGLVVAAGILHETDYCPGAS